MSKENKDQLNRISSFWENKDGAVSLDEFMDLTELDKDDKDHVNLAMEALKLSDTDNDGKLSKQEFVKMMSKLYIGVHYLVQIRIWWKHHSFFSGWGRRICLRSNRGENGKEKQSEKYFVPGPSLLQILPCENQSEQIKVFLDYKFSVFKFLIEHQSLFCKECGCASLSLKNEVKKICCQKLMRVLTMFTTDINEVTLEIKNIYSPSYMQFANIWKKKWDCNERRFWNRWSTRNLFSRAIISLERG